MRPSKGIMIQDIGHAWGQKRVMCRSIGLGIRRTLQLVLANALLPIELPKNRSKLVLFGLHCHGIVSCFIRKIEGSKHGYQSKTLPWASTCSAPSAQCMRPKLDACSLHWLSTGCCSFTRQEDQDVGNERNIVEHVVPHGRSSQGITVSARNCDHHHIANLDGQIRPLPMQASCSCA
ncbi:Hypothetical predicted protein [Olea europaea subsp. europaea]|uniref:Uncharacterized protein n=1 Tax=Olea europaea subsp. europaea TaxID=158383 RepID=A0A8S0T9U9_OLEEU|nr:Hypothetical predicted protein [Olea europaea subsp. europaea]